MITAFKSIYSKLEGACHTPKLHTLDKEGWKAREQTQTRTFGSKYPNVGPPYNTSWKSFEGGFGIPAKF